MDTTNRRFFIYARKSTDDLSRQVRSIDDQIAELRELARRENLHVVDVLIEKQTAKVPGRPVFNAMLERVEKGEAQGILAWHPDRLARNSLDGGRVIYLVDMGKILELKFPTFVFDPSPSGKFMLSIMFGQSKYYVDNLSENITRGKRQKVKNGLWPQWAPVGYLNDKTTRGIRPDPQRAPLIRKAFEFYATGNHTLDELAERINGLGLIGIKGEALFRTRYHHLLKNPIYCGIMRYKGELHEGKHEPIVSKNLFDKVQEVMKRKSKPKTPTLKPFLYRGLFRCDECGCFVTTETQKGHNYLRCNKRVKRDCSQPYVREETIGEQVTAYLRAIALPADTADCLIVALEAERGENSQSRQDSICLVRSKVSDLDAKLDRLMTAYLDRTVSLEEYRNVKSKLVEEKQSLKDKTTALEANRGDWFEPAIRFLKAAKSTGFLADEGTEQEKRDFLRKVGSNLTISNRHLSVVPREAWQLVVDQGRIAQHNAALSSSAAAFVGKSDAYSSKRRGRDSNPR